MSVPTVPVTRAGHAPAVRGAVVPPGLLAHHDRQLLVLPGSGQP